jgi:hypothetical protein
MGMSVSKIMPEDLWNAGRIRDMLSYLKAFPTQMWIDWRDTDGETLLHYASRLNDIEALVKLIQIGIDINIKSITDRTAAQVAIMNNRDIALKMLIAFGANISDCMNCSIANQVFYAKILIANRLWITNSMKEEIKRGFRQECIIQLFHFEKSIRKCRSAVVSILALQKLGRIHVGCKYAAREIAFAIWATRENEEWGLRP